MGSRSYERLAKPSSFAAFIHPGFKSGTHLELDGFQSLAYWHSNQVSSSSKLSALTTQL